MWNRFAHRVQTVSVTHEEHTEVASDDDFLKDDDIQKLLAEAKGGLGGPKPPEPPKPAAPPAAAASGGANLLDANELEALLSGAATPAPPPPKPAATAAAAPKPAAKPAPAASATSKRASQLLDQVEKGIDLAMREDRRGRKNVASDASGAQPFEFSEFGNSESSSPRNYSLGKLDDVELDLHIELGRAELMIDEVLSLRDGAVVQLDKMAGDPVDIVVNGRLIARGEVLVLNDNFCVRVAEIVTPDY